jgi:tetratricopeptide (TPR) repeat protein
LEASTAWRRAGDDSRADQLLESLVEAGGEDAAYARVELASNAFDKGDRAAAAACLDRLAKDPELHDGHCQLAAELLASHGDLPGALRWYDRFVSRLPDEQLAALDGPDGRLTFAAIPLRARRQLREQLGFPPDAADERVPEHPGEIPGALEAALARLDPATHAVSPHQDRTQVLVFQKTERDRAARTWPDDYVDDPDYFLHVERRRRVAAENGVVGAVIVPASVADLIAFAERDGGSPTEEQTRSRYLPTVPEERHIRWPPARNDRCWCGSGVKYKKCCGRPNL